MIQNRIACTPELVKALYPEWFEDSSTHQAIENHFKHNVSASFDIESYSSLPDDPVSIQDQLRVISSFPYLPIPTPFDTPIAVILAGGRGSRMGPQIHQKALCPIQGQPALLRAVEMYRTFGIDRFVIVVGAGYKDVIQCVGQDDESITFLLQDQQLGTGHAARLASRYLKFLGYEGHILVVMGDKFITHQGLETLVAQNAQDQPDLLLATASKKAWPDSGRVYKDDAGHVCAIIEKPDLVQKQLLADFFDWPENPVPCQAYLDHMLHLWNRPDKLEQVLTPVFWQALHQNTIMEKNDPCVPLQGDSLKFDITNSIQCTASDIEEHCEEVNISVYIFHHRALYEATDGLQSNNAQGELYLTDAVQYLTANHHNPPYRIKTARMPNDSDIMGFNTLEELDHINRILKPGSSRKM